MSKKHREEAPAVSCDLAQGQLERVVKTLRTDDRARETVLESKL